MEVEYHDPRTPRESRKATVWHNDGYYVYFEEYEDGCWMHIHSEDAVDGEHSDPRPQVIRDTAETLLYDDRATKVVDRDETTIISVEKGSVEDKPRRVR